jgi:hypothetical protein
MATPAPAPAPACPTSHADSASAPRSWPSLARRLHGVGGAGVEGSACISAGAGAIGAGVRSAAAIGVGLSAGAR